MRIVIFILFLATCLLYASVDNKKIFVVANMLDKQSVELAKTYCKYRAIPEKNIILLDIPKNTGIVSRDFYVQYIENALFSKLIELDAINALDLKSNDSYGRSQLILSRINLDYLVLCKGVPWGVSDREKSKRMAISPANSDASVDSEISARFLPANKYKGFMKNPAFAKTGDEWRSYGLIRVARLDGASFDDVKKMLQNTQDVESRGIVGRAYFDKCKRAKLGDDWIDSAAKILKEQGFDVSVDESRTVMNLGHRMDYPALYFGWYSSHPCGYFSIPKFSMKGIIGWHIYSFSAFNLSNKNAWTPTLISNGATATDGNVFEPYLALTRNIGVFTKLMFEDNLLPAEAAFAALPVLSWQNIYIGDPLFNPLKVDLDTQLANLSNDELSQYVVIRKANLIMSKLGKDKAREFLKKYEGKIPDVAIKWKLFELSDIQSEKLDYILDSINYEKLDYLGLSFQACKQLEQMGKADKALEYYEKIFYKYLTIDSIARYSAICAESAAKRCNKEVSGLIKTMLSTIADEKRKAQEAKLKKQNSHNVNKKL